VEKSILIEA